MIIELLIKNIEKVTLARISIILCALICLCIEKSSAEVQSNSILKLKGSVSLFSETYKNFSDSANINNRPKLLSRLIFNSTVTLFDQVVIPINLFLSTDQDVNLRQPFNQFGIAPQITKDLRIYAGYHSVQLSQFSMGNIRPLGGGVDYKLSNYRVIFSAGRSKQEIASDTLKGIIGNYTRYCAAGRISYENEVGTVLGLSLLRSWDKMPDNISQDKRLPIDNIVTAIDYAFCIVKDLYLVGEFAGSGFTRDQRSMKLSPDTLIKSSDFFSKAANTIDKIFNFRLSSRFDVASYAAIDYRNSGAFTGKFKASYIGPGFTSSGYPELVNDKIEFTFEPSLKLFNNSLFANGSIGQQTDNLAQEREVASTRIIGSANIYYQATSMLGMNLTFQNYGVRTKATIDSLSVQNVFYYFQFVPRYTFKFDEYPQSVSIGFISQKFDDKNVYTQNMTKNSVSGYNFSWNGYFDKISSNLNVNISKNETASSAIKALDISAGVSHSILDGKSVPQITALFSNFDETSYTAIKNNSSLKNRLSLQLTSNYRFSENADVIANILFSNFRYLPDSNMKNYSDILASLELRYFFN